MRTGSTSRFRSKYIWFLVIFLVVVLLSFKLPFGQKLSIAMGPVLYAAQAPIRWYQGFSLWFDDAQDLQSRYEKLEADFAEQHALAQELSELKAENNQLRQLLKITQVDSFIWKAARVVSRGQEEKSRRLILQTESVSIDDVVVSHEGLVGLIDRSGNDYAVVRTILDASLAVPITKKDGTIAGLVRGDGERLLVDFVPLNKAPVEGDLLITSGAGGLFPAGLPVAVVEKVNAVEGGIFAEVIASPAAYWKRDAWLAIAGRNQH